MIKFFCGTSTLMLVRGQFVNCVFALHAPVPPISGFWAAGAFRSSSCVWCSHVFGHRVSGSLCAFIFFRQALFVQ